MIIDSHCHLDYEPMFSNLDNVIKRADQSNVKIMLTISVADKKYNNIIQITNKYSTAQSPSLRGRQAGTQVDWQLMAAGGWS